MASIQVLVFTCAVSLALFVVVSGKPLSTQFEQFKTAVISKNCEFPAKETYLPSPLHLHFTLEPCLAASHSGLDVNNSWFAVMLCSTFFNISVELCEHVKKSGSNYLSTSALNKLVMHPNWNVCNATNDLKLRYNFLSFMVEIPSQCNSLCGGEGKLTEVCNLLVASIYIWNHERKVEEEKKASSAGSSTSEQETEGEVTEDKKHGGSGSGVAGGKAQVSGVPGSNTPAPAVDVDAASETARQVAGNPNIARLDLGASASDVRHITPGGTPHDGTNSEPQSHEGPDLDGTPGGTANLPIPDPKEGDNIETEPTPAPAQVIPVASGGNPGTGSLSSGTSEGNLQSLGDKNLNPIHSGGDNPVTDSSRGENRPTPAAGTQKPDQHQPALEHEGTPIPFVPGSNQEGQDVGGSSTQGTAVPEIRKGSTKPDEWSSQNTDGDHFDSDLNGNQEDLKDGDLNNGEDFFGYDMRKTAGHSEDDDDTKKTAGHNEDDDDTRKTAGHSEDDDDTRKTAGHSEDDDDMRKTAGHSEDDDDERKTAGGHSEGLEDKHNGEQNFDQHEDVDFLVEKEQSNKNPSPDKQQEETGGGDGGRKDSDKQPVWKGSSGYEEEEEAQSGHFMAYFVTAVVLCISGYVIYHNKQKIFAFLLEGRREGQRRRTAAATGGGAKYSKLQPSVEEVMPSLEKSTTSKSYVY